jgi:hypothetical protein
MVKTDIIINDEEYEFTKIAGKIEKFKKDIFIPYDKFGFDLQTASKPCSIHGLQNRVWVWKV